VAKSDRGPLHVLVVEDDPHIAQILATVLADEGYDVDLADNGRLALEQIAAQDYDLIFSDLRMPELDGVGLYWELERRQPDLLRRLIVITGTSAHPEYESFLAETHVPFLEKLFSLVALEALARQVLSGSQPVVQFPRR
jgi:DNA-binding NtrC family response regulator